MGLHLRAMDAIDAAVPGILFLVEVPPPAALTNKFISYLILMEKNKNNNSFISIFSTCFALFNVLFHYFLVPLYNFVKHLLRLAGTELRTARVAHWTTERLGRPAWRF